MDRIAYMKSISFESLRSGNELLANLARLAEAVLHIDPGSALTRLRSFAEELTKAIYKEELLPRMPQSTFYDLVKNPVFADCVSKPLVHQINFLRIQGNDTAHGAEGDLRNAQLALKTAYQLAMYMAIKYYGTAQASIPAFAEVKDPAAMLASLQKTVSSYEKELNQQQEALQSVMDKLEQERTRHLDKVGPPAKPDQQKRQQQSQKVADSLQWNEAKTRALLIDAMLLQAGWDVSNPAQVGQEVDVDFPGNVSGKGGCNRYGGRATVGDGTIGFGMMQATQRACQPPAGDQEGRFHRALTRATGWQVDGDRLVLTDAGGKPLARFLRAR